MAKIRINPETLTSQASQLEGYKTDHEGTYQNIKSLMLTIAQDWDGQSREAFMLSFEQNDVNFKKFAADVESFRQRLLRAAEDMRLADEAVKAKMSQMG